MKHLIVSLFAFAAVAGYSQKKPKIGEAEKAWTDGDYSTAKSVVDLAAEHEKTKTDAKTWFMYGLVYASMDTAGMAEGDLTEARKGFDKARQIKGDGENFLSGATGIIAQSQAEVGYWAHYLNAGVDAFQKEDPDAAVEAFSKCTVIMPDSLIAYYYAGLAAISVEKFDFALDKFDQFLERGGREVDAVTRKLYIMSSINKDNEAALAYVQKVKSQYPDDKDITDWEFRLLFALDKVDLAVDRLKEAIEKDPTNPELRFNLGVMYERMERMEDARAEYFKAVEIDENYYNANFNIGVMYRIDLVDAGNERNNLGISKADQARGKVLNDKIAEISAKAIPFWERLNVLKPDDKTTLETLQYMYLQIKEYDKAEKIADQMDALGYGN
jgi:tetratricopeptide (TPR) repeat protein